MLNLPLHMIWAGRIYHLLGDMNPLASMPSSFVVEERVSLEFSSITRPAGIVMLRKRKKDKQNKMSSQRTSREAQKVWRLMKLWRWYRMRSIIAYLSLMSSSVTMTAQCNIFSSIYPKVPKFKLCSHPRKNLMSKYHSHTSLHIFKIPEDHYAIITIIA